jgi:hypothetical protein
LATYTLLKETSINPVISSLLKETTITSKDENTIVFSNPRDKRDINFLNIFFQPILPKNTIDNIGKQNL